MPRACAVGNTTPRVTSDSSEWRNDSACVFHPRREDQDAARSQRMLLVEGVERHLALNHVDRNRVVRAVGRDVAARCQRHERQAEWAFLASVRALRPCFELDFLASALGRSPGPSGKR